MSDQNPTAEEAQLVERFLRVVFSFDDEGNSPHSAEDIANFTPMLLLFFTRLIPPNEVPENAQILLGQFMHTLGKPSSPAELQQRLEAHYAAHPISPQLLASFQKATALLKPAAEEADKKRLARMLGQATDVVAPTMTGQPAAQGAMATRMQHLTEKAKK